MRTVTIKLDSAPDKEVRDSVVAHINGKSGGRLKAAFSKCGTYLRVKGDSALCTVALRLARARKDLGEWYVHSDKKQ